MTERKSLFCGWLALAMALSTSAPVWAADPSAALPEAVKKTLATAFPDAVLREAETERERGVRYFEVELVLPGGDRVEAEIDDFGGIGEVERAIPLEDAPTGLVDMVKAGGDLATARIERHERYGAGRDGRFVPLDKPRVTYEVTYRAQGQRKTARWQPVADDVPPAVLKSAQDACPRGILVDTTRAALGGIEVYRLHFIQMGADLLLTESADGVLMETRRTVALGSVPKAVQDALRAAAGDGTIQRLCRVDVQAQVKDGTVTKVAEGQARYEARLRRDARVADVVVGAAGEPIGPVAWRDVVAPVPGKGRKVDRDDDDDDDDDDNDDDNDEDDD